MSEEHLRIEYDPEFFGGNYDDVGNFKLISLRYINEKHNGDVGAAFEELTGYDRANIVHYSESELYDAEGEMLDD